MTDTDEADAGFQDWLRENLSRAAEHFGLTVTGEPLFGWLLRSISAPATGPGGPVWLKVASEQLDWADGDAMAGNLDANVLTDLSKPRVLDTLVWDERDWRRQRAEVFTLMPGKPCAPTMTPPAGLVLSADWWEHLTHTLDQLRQADTTRANTNQVHIDRRIRDVLGDGIAVTIDCWETVHGDLHWGNLFRDPFGIVDWEQWGTGPVGTDAATLYPYSLAAPSVADAVHAHFADILDSAQGRRAQLCVAARLLHRSTFGDHPELGEPLRRLAVRLLVR